MSKQRKPMTFFSGEPPIDHASALVQEYTRKLRSISQRIREIREQYLARAEIQLKQSSPNEDSPRNITPQQQMLRIQVADSFRSRYDDYAGYLRALVPQAKKLAQHVSQLITHGTNETVLKIELGLRVAELESAIEIANKLSRSPLPPVPT